MAARIFAFFIWAALVASLVFWGLRLTSRPSQAPSHAVPVESKGTARGDLARLFGADAPKAEAPQQAPTDSRFKLLGTFAAADPEARTGWATIAVGDGPPRTYSVGTKILGTDLHVQSVTLRSVSLGPADGGAATVSLQMPTLPVAATGTLPRSDGGSVLPASPALGGTVAPPAPTPEAVPDGAMSLRSQIGRAMETIAVPPPGQPGADGPPGIPPPPPH